MTKVVLVWGGWSCSLGYVHWAYVAEAIEGERVNTVTPGSEKIGSRIYEAVMRKDITNTKNCDFGKTPNPFPKVVCKEWLEKHKDEYELLEEVKMRTD